jgi:hypothetical protein
VKCPEVNGSWQLNSTATELILTPGNCTDPDSVERWTIIAVELRRLRLERKRSEDKRGTLNITYFLEAVPQ